MGKSKKIFYLEKSARPYIFLKKFVVQMGYNVNEKIYAHFFCFFCFWKISY